MTAPAEPTRATAASGPRPYAGDFAAWNGGGAFLGQGSGSTAIAPHSHYAIQIAIGMPAGLAVQFGRRGDWQHCAAALIPSRATHSIDVSGCDSSAVIFVEPETAEGRALTRRLGGAPQCLEAAALAQPVARLEHAWRVEQSVEAVEQACRALIRDLAGTAAAPEPSDARVLAAIAHILGRLEDPPSLEEVAKLVGLSPSRFRHLFVAETGMPMRTYVLWRRLLHACSLLMRGETLTGAAHAAGFADSAHLSRTARTMFGLPPSVLQMKGPLSARQGKPAAHSS
jgi:AraC-like DNA-binding protein